MVIQKTNPKGIDLVIQNYQGLLHTYLLKKWGLEGDKSNQYECYGRAYRNRKGAGYVAEVYTAGNEYKEVHHDDRLAALSFFGESERIEDGKAEIHLVFFVNLTKIKPAILHRADEEAHNDVIQFALKGYQGFEFISLEQWSENVLREYPGTLSNLQVNAGSDSVKIDLHPYHCFRINLNLLYTTY